MAAHTSRCRGHPVMEGSCRRSSGFPGSIAKHNIRLNKLPFDPLRKRLRGITGSHNIYHHSDE